MGKRLMLTDPGAIACPGCGKVVSEKSLKSHQKTESCVKQSEVNKYSKMGWQTPNILRYFQEGDGELTAQNLFGDSPHAPAEYAPTHFAKSGWGRKARTHMAWVMPDYVSTITDAIIAVEPLNWNTHESRKERIRTWCRTIFANEETLNVVRTLHQSLVETVEAWPYEAREAACIEWAKRIAHLFDLPMLLTDSEEVQRLDQEAYEASRRETNETYAREAAQETERYTSVLRGLEVAGDLYDACRAVLEQVSERDHPELLAAIRKVVSKTESVFIRNTSD